MSLKPYMRSYLLVLLVKLFAIPCVPGDGIHRCCVSNRALPNGPANIRRQLHRIFLGFGLYDHDADSLLLSKLATPSTSYHSATLSDHYVLLVKLSCLLIKYEISHKGMASNRLQCVQFYMGMAVYTLSDYILYISSYLQTSALIGSTVINKYLEPTWSIYNYQYVAFQVYCRIYPMACGQ